MTGIEILTAIIEILVGGFTQLGSGMGAALSGFAQSIFMVGSGESQALSVFAILVVVFAAVSLSLSLFRWVLNFVTSWGNRNR